MKKVASEKAVLAPLAAVVAIATLLMLPPFGGAVVVPAATTGTGLVTNYCTRACGNMSIPYPFGIERGCYHAAWFNLTCDHLYLPPRLFLGDRTMEVEVLDISVEHSTVRINSPATPFLDSRIAAFNWTWGLGFTESGPYFLSESASMLQATGCGVQVSILGGLNNSLVSSCAAICPVVRYKDGGVGNTMGNGSCTGIGCCQASIVLGYSSYTVQIHRISASSGWDFHPTSVYIVDQSYNMNVDYPNLLPPATLDWIISTSTCPTNMTAPECLSTHSYCQDSSSLGHGGYMCKCSDGYHGNPYVHAGCKGMVHSESNFLTNIYSSIYL
jgi:hypothetical protein